MHGECQPMAIAAEVTAATRLVGFNPSSARLGVTGA